MSQGDWESKSFQAITHCPLERVRRDIRLKIDLLFKARPQPVHLFCALIVPQFGRAEIEQVNKSLCRVGFAPEGTMPRTVQGRIQMLLHHAISSRARQKFHWRRLRQAVTFSRRSPDQDSSCIWMSESVNDSCRNDRRLSTGAGGTE
jgi:hypothetical protein